LILREAAGKARGLFRLWATVSFRACDRAYGRAARFLRSSLTLRVSSVLVS